MGKIHAAALEKPPLLDQPAYAAASFRAYPGISAERFPVKRLKGADNALLQAQQIGFNSEAIHGLMCMHVSRDTCCAELAFFHRNRAKSNIAAILHTIETHQLDGLIGTMLSHLDAVAKRGDAEYPAT